MVLVSTQNSYLPDKLCALVEDARELAAQHALWSLGTHTHTHTLGPRYAHTPTLTLWGQGTHTPAPTLELKFVQELSIILFD